MCGKTYLQANCVGSFVMISASFSAYITASILAESQIISSWETARNNIILVIQSQKNYTPVLLTVITST